MPSAASRRGPSWRAAPQLEAAEISTLAARVEVAKAGVAPVSLEEPLAAHR